MDLEENSLGLFEAVGLIPATEKTPDIYYCDGPSSEKVAALTFLTLWFMDEPIQKLVQQRASAFICGLSPLSGGKRLEQALTKDLSITGALVKRENFDLSGSLSRYTATCFYPQWDGDTIIRKGCVAVYASSINEDEANGYTSLWNRKLESQFDGMDVPSEHGVYRPVSCKVFLDSDFGVSSLFNAFSLSGQARDEFLSQILKREFSDINSLYDMVPKRTAHEVAHLLEHGSGLVVRPFIEEEVSFKVPRGNRMLSHYRKATEAVAELAGISILQRVQNNAKLGFGMPTTMLDKILPESFEYVEQQVAHICGEPSF